MRRRSSRYIEVSRSRHVLMHVHSVLHLHILHAHVAMTYNKAHGPLGVVVCGLHIMSGAALASVWCTVLISTTPAVRISRGSFFVGYFRRSSNTRQSVSSMPAFPAARASAAASRNIWAQHRRHTRLLWPACRGTMTCSLNVARERDAARWYDGVSCEAATHAQPLFPIIWCGGLIIPDIVGVLRAVPHATARRPPRPMHAAWSSWRIFISYLFSSESATPLYAPFSPKAG